MGVMTKSPTPTHRSRIPGKTGNLVFTLQPPYMLDLRDINFSYQRQVLYGITLDVRAGEIVALLGANGSGKSTLLAVAHGALKPQSGEVLFEGRPVADFSRREAARRMALVAQSGEIR